jgi:hypothetical protein
VEISTRSSYKKQAKIARIQDPFKNHSHLYHQRSIQKAKFHGCFFSVITDPIKKKEQRGEVGFWGWSSDPGPHPEIVEPRSEMEAR